VVTLIAPVLLPLVAVLEITASNVIWVSVALVMLLTWIPTGVFTWPPEKPWPVIVTDEVVAPMRPLDGETLSMRGVTFPLAPAEKRQLLAGS